MLPTPLKSSPLWWGAIPKGAFLHTVTDTSLLCQLHICLQKASFLVIRESSQPPSAFPLHLHNPVTAIPAVRSSNSTTSRESISSHLWHFLLCCYFSNSGKHVKYKLYGGGNFNSTPEQHWTQRVFLFPNTVSPGRKRKGRQRTQRTDSGSAIGQSVQTREPNDTFRSQHGLPNKHCFREWR